MSVLVHTSVWTLALRRRHGREHPVVQELRDLIDETRAQLIGEVRQQILSGIREPLLFLRLRAHLRAFPDLPVETTDYERAAEFLNLCGSQGIQGTGTDFLLCAVADRCGMAILTAEESFSLYARHLPITLHALQQRH